MFYKHLHFFYCPFLADENNETCLSIPQRLYYDVKNCVKGSSGVYFFAVLYSKKNVRINLYACVNPCGWFLFL